MSIVFNLLIAGAVATFFKKKLEECYALTAMIFAFALYIPGLYLSFTPGLIVFYGAVISSILYLTFCFVHDKKQLYNAIVTPGTFFLFCTIVFFFFYCKGRGIDTSDDYYLWNLRIKNFLYFGKIRGVPTTEIGSSHPPIISLWNYLAGKTWVNEKSHAIYLCAQNVLMISFVAPLMSKIQGVHLKLKTILAGVIVLLVPTVAGEAYHTLTNDLMLGVIFFYYIYTFWHLSEKGYSDTFDTLCLIFGAATMVMTKRTGGVILSLLLFMCILDVHCHEKRIRNCLLISTIVAGGVVFSWSGVSQPLFVIVLGTLASVACASIYGHISCRIWKVIFWLFVLSLLTAVVGIIAWRYQDSNSILYLKFVCGILVTFPKPSFVITIMDVLIIMWLFLRKANVNLICGQTKRQLSGYAGRYIISVAAYIILMWYLEITQIAPSNGGGTDGFGIRYFMPLLIPIYYITLLLILEIDDFNSVLYLAIMLLLVQAYSDVESAVENMANKTPEMEFNEFSKNGITLTPEDKVYFIDENDGYGYTDRAFYNYICPARSQFGTTYNFLTDGCEGEMEENLQELTEELTTGNFNYVYIQLISENTMKKYASIFQSTDDIGNGRLYRVVNNGAGIELEWLKHD